jgi:hypothetical protein
MRWFMTILVALIMLVAGSPLMAEETKSVAMAQPSVVKTVPQCGKIRVDPATKEIRVTFSKDMKNKCWSWCTADEGQFPEMVGQPRYLKDKRTCVLTVKLKPKTTYAIWLNTQRHINFKDTGGRPAIPYLLVFETK